MSRIGLNMALQRRPLPSPCRSCAAPKPTRASSAALGKLWHEAAHLAAVSHVIARRFTTLNADTALLAGLLQCVGKLYLLTRAARFPALLADDAGTTSASRPNGTCAWRRPSCATGTWTPRSSRRSRACENLAREHAGATDLTDVLVASARADRARARTRARADAVPRHAGRAPHEARRRRLQRGAGRIPRRDPLAATGAQRHERRRSHQHDRVARDARTPWCSAS